MIVRSYTKLPDGSCIDKIVTSATKMVSHVQYESVHWEHHNIFNIHVSTRGIPGMQYDKTWNLSSTWSDPY